MDDNSGQPGRGRVLSASILSFTETKEDEVFQKRRQSDLVKWLLSEVVMAQAYGEAIMSCINSCTKVSSMQFKGT